MYLEDLEHESWVGELIEICSVFSGSCRNEVVVGRMKMLLEVAKVT